MTNLDHRRRGDDAASRRNSPVRRPCRGLDIGAIPEHHDRSARTRRDPDDRPAERGGSEASFITTKDGTEIYYKDWGKGSPVVFSHGWPFNADVWDDQMMFMASHGFRCIAFDRRGHGRSSQPWEGNDYDTFAEDLSELIGALELRAAALVGHSAGAGDIARYIGRYGTADVSGAVSFHF